MGGVQRSGELFGKQLVAVLLAAFYSYVVTFLILFLLSKCMVIKPTSEEILDLDMALHGEESYGKHTGRDGPLPRNSKYLPNDDDVGAKSTELDLEIATVGAPSSARTTSN